MTTSTNKQVIKSVHGVYQWLYCQMPVDAKCASCGKCCDFEIYGHEIFITTPEIIYFKHNLTEPIRQVTDGICPYMKNHKCSVHEQRFASCRIFFCKGDTQLQNALSEAAAEQFKTICNRFDIPYRYMPLKTALKYKPA
jgi:Fe-S-cluster containining protein